MKILRLEITNFKGIRNFAFDANGNNIEIMGDNATGKTTMFDAFLWLLFDKDSQNKKDFQIKTLDPKGNVIPAIDHAVEATFEINGQRLTLRKVYAEKWTKKRGNPVAEFSGHTTDYFIDGVPAKKNEYADRIEQIAKEDVFKLLTNPAFFNEQLHWQERRKILLSVCGDISDNDVIASDKLLSKLPEILQGRKLEDHRKVIAAKRSEINKELEKIPVRIDESTKSLPNVFGLEPALINSQLADLKTKLQAKYSEKAQVANGGATAEKTKLLREVEARIQGIKNQYQIEVDGKVQVKRSRLNELKDQAHSIQLAIRSKEINLSSETQINYLENIISNLRKEWNEANSKAFEHSQECTCPTCGQDLPEERLTEAREKALAKFNLEKSQRLQEINAMGKQRSEELKTVLENNESLSKEISALKDQLGKVVQDGNGLQVEISSMVQVVPNLSTNQEYTKAINEKQDLEREIASLGDDNSALIAKVNDEITAINSDIDSLEKSLSRIELNKLGQARIEELKAREKELAAEFEKLEGELYLTEQFIRSKVKMLEEKINGRFKYARFKLFDVQINGGVVECCETLYEGVPYSGGLNNAARINVGLDIINTLSEHYGFTAPIFVDNAEAVTRLIPTRGQVIKLVVSEPDKKLRISEVA